MTTTGIHIGIWSKSSLAGKDFKGETYKVQLPQQLPGGGVAPSPATHTLLTPSKAGRRGAQCETLVVTCNIIFQTIPVPFSASTLWR